MSKSQIRNPSGGGGCNPDAELTSAAGAVDLSVSPGAGTGVGAHVVNTLPDSLTGPGVF